jgi:hypothetical protein
VTKIGCRRPCGRPSSICCARWLPLAPLIYAIDAAVSCLRAWTADELLAHAHTAAAGRPVRRTAGTTAIGRLDLRLTWLVVEPGP